MAAHASDAQTSSSASEVLGGEEHSGRALFLLGSVLALGGVLALLSTTLVSVGIGRLAETFEVPLSTVQWVSTAYLLAIAVVIPVAGWAMDRFGEKALWQASLAVFLAGCVLTAVAPSVGVLIGARVLQGLGGGLFEPIMLTVLARSAGPRRATIVMSLVQIPITLAPVFGPMAGGVLIDRLGWEWLFWINVPFVLLCAVLAQRSLPADPSRHERATSRLDLTGTVLLPTSLAGLLLGLSQMTSDGGIASPVVLVSFGVGTVLLLAYVVHALRMRGVPLVDVRLFASGRFAASAVTAFLFGASVYGVMFVLPLFFQQAGGFDAWTSGLLLAPQGVGTVLILPVVSRLVARFGPRAVVLAGMVLAALGTIAFTQLDPREGTALLVCSLLVRGIGLGTTLAPALSSGFASIAPEDTGRASSALIASIQLGGSVSTAVLAVVVQQRLAGHAAITQAYGGAFWWPLGICVLGAAVAVRLPGRETRAG
ncbi:MDR family MFS transporter [Saccharopolyspora shandongensis]|uniref:Drug resistance transporter, EmrB/QacA subfamily n=1 Tax=Saccharopolyspora shandongensis TaxID=418495 RepID=A0A1H2R7X3_9PSEU|nr:MDR family MFS transporter [Saccharopolyspora shandongensis]SDW15497.1 drug resistance transporter, EmrB/QacA subfamily [Saccharopolyspora shandongensis]